MLVVSYLGPHCSEHGSDCDTNSKSWKAFCQTLIVINLILNLILSFNYQYVNMTQVLFLPVDTRKWITSIETINQNCGSVLRDKKEIDSQIAG